MDIFFSLDDVCIVVLSFKEMIMSHVVAHFEDLNKNCRPYSVAILGSQNL